MKMMVGTSANRAHLNLGLGWDKKIEFYITLRTDDDMKVMIKVFVG